MKAVRAAQKSHTCALLSSSPGNHFPVLSPYYSGMLAQACNLSTGRMQAKGSDVQGQLRLQTNLKEKEWCISRITQHCTLRLALLILQDVQMALYFPKEL